MSEPVTSSALVTASEPVTVRLCLVSHTNAGKTTLARTLLRRDVGEVGDRAHVTELAERLELESTAAGDVLEVWDTPGFGDSVRLLKRLRGRGNALGWFLSAVWDRYTDRPFWSSQQALKAARDSADLVLYVANAAEDPAAAAYVEPELEILDWLDKPVCVVLNQLGEAGVVDTEADLRRWRERLAPRLAPAGRVIDVLPLDAFSRCWVQEHALYTKLGPHLPDAKQAAFERLRAAWHARQLALYARAMDVLARQLLDAATDHEPLPDPGLAAHARAWLDRLRAGDEARSPEELAAQRALSKRLDTAVRAATDAIVRLHGLDGRAAGEILESIGRDLAVTRAVDPQSAGLVGGVVSGALGGLAADVAAGGLTFGAGAVLGGLLGAFGARGAAKAWNVALGTDRGEVRWSPEFLDGRFAAALIRYLAVAHFGRGRGEFRAVQVPESWRRAVAGATAARGEALRALWAEAAGVRDGEVTATATSGNLRDSLATRLARHLAAAGADALAELYPEAHDVLVAPALPPLSRRSDA